MAEPVIKSYWNDPVKKAEKVKKAAETKAAADLVKLKEKKEK